MRIKMARWDNSPLRGRHPRNPDRAAEKLDYWLRVNGINATLRGWPSRYLQLETDDGEYAVIRFADHPQPAGGGYRVVDRGGFTDGGRFGEADISVSPNEASFRDAVDFIRRRVTPGRDLAAFMATLGRKES